MVEESVWVSAPGGGIDVAVEAEMLAEGAEGEGVARDRLDLHFGDGAGLRELYGAYLESR